MNQISIAKLFLLFSISLVLFSCGKDKDPEPDTTIVDKVYEGSLINPSTVEMQKFLDEGYVIINGNLEFTENDSLASLNSFSNLTSITGSIKLLKNPEFRSFKGLEKLESIGGDLIYDAFYISDKLLSIDALNNLKSIEGSLIFKNSSALKDLTSLSNLEYVGGNFELIDLPNFKTISSLNILDSIGGHLILRNLLNLEQLLGFSGLKSIGGNFSLSLETPDVNTKLYTLAGLWTVTHLNGNLTIKNYLGLYNFCALSNLLTTNGLSGDFLAEGNLYNPTKAQITNGECENDNPIIILDGIYIKGDGTALSDFDSKGIMSITRNEVTQEDRASLLEKYMAIKGGSEGFNIYKVDGGEVKSYGPGNDFANVQESDLGPDEPNLGLFRGNISESENPFTVPEDGLYHVAYDTEIGIVTIAKVKWGIIGAATPGGWAESTSANQTFGLSEVIFTIDNIALTRSDFKFRYSNGWKVILSPDFDLGDGNVGIKVNANIGGSIDNLVPGGNNIMNEILGKYTVEIIWTLEQNYRVEMIKTGEIAENDYSETEIGLIGDGIIENGTPVGWDNPILLHIPDVTDDVIYTWTFDNIEVTSEGAFKIRESLDWNGIILGYNDVIMGGESINDFVADGDGNFVPLNNGNYDFELLIDAATENYTLIVNPASGPEPELYLLGSGCEAGWDNTISLPFSGTNGEYTITTNLNGEDGYIKFITTLGQWAPMYGTDDNGTAQSGNLVFRETESDPDPAAIPLESNGTYTIIANTNTMTYNIIPAK